MRIEEDDFDAFYQKRYYGNLLNNQSKSSKKFKIYNQHDKTSHNEPNGEFKVITPLREKERQTSINSCETPSPSSSELSFCVKAPSQGYQSELRTRTYLDDNVSSLSPPLFRPLQSKKDPELSVENSSVRQLYPFPYNIDEK